MTTKTTTKMCGTCGHKYDVKCNTLSGILTVHYCKHCANKGDYDFDIVKLGGLCSNYIPKEDGNKD